MVAELFKFWSRIGPAETVHPDDRDVWMRAAHHFERGCLPTPYMGKLKTAAVVLLYLSPGFDQADTNEAKTRVGQKRHRLERTGSAPLPDADQLELANRWIVDRTHCYDRPWTVIREHVAVLDISPYHSRQFKDGPLLAALPSSRVALEYAQSVLFPDACSGSGRRVVVCLRGAPYWGLAAGKRYGRALFAPRTNRSGHMEHGEQRETIIRVVRRAIDRGRGD